VPKNSSAKSVAQTSFFILPISFVVKLCCRRRYSFFGGKRRKSLRESKNIHYILYQYKFTAFITLIQVQIVNKSVIAHLFSQKAVDKEFFSVILNLRETFLKGM
jgi:hypothetical protein